MSEVNRTPDLLTALAERLSMTLARQATALEQINRTEWEAIAREALAFVAERLPTRLDVAMLLNRNSGTLWDEIGEGALCDLYEKADAILRVLRGWLGVEP